MAPRHLGPSPMSRRSFLKRAGLTAAALPSAAAILSACAKPGSLPEGVTILPLARPDHPVTLPMWKDPIADGLPIEKGATLKVYNWADYFYKKVLKDFEKFYDVNIEWTPFNNMEEAIQKMATGQIKPDVLITDTDKINSLVEARLIQPLNHSYIPSLKKDIWADYQNPFYDQEWRYTVPYVTWTSGIAYRRDHIDDAEVNEKGYEILWDSKYRGKVSIYDSYRDVIGMALMRNGVKDINTGNADDILAAKDAILDLLDKTSAKIAINGVYVGLPEESVWLAEAWSGDAIGAQFYLPKGTKADVLGYWYPEKQGNYDVGNDTITVTSSAASPVLAHKFLDWFQNPTHAIPNFEDWNGYQPPQKSIDPNALVKDQVVPKSLSHAVVRPSDFKTGQFINVLSAEDDQRWQDAWAEISTSG